MTTSDELETIGQLVLAAVLGVVIGLEREAAGQSAGERTRALVGDQGVADSSRIASNVPHALNGSSGVPFTTLRLILEALVRSVRVPRASVGVSDRGTLGGLTQFVAQFGFAGSSTSL